MLHKTKQIASVFTPHIHWFTLSSGRETGLTCFARKYLFTSHITLATNAQHCCFLAAYKFIPLILSSLDRPDKFQELPPG